MEIEIIKEFDGKYVVCRTNTGQKYVGTLKIVVPYNYLRITRNDGIYAVVDSGIISEIGEFQEGNNK